MEKKIVMLKNSDSGPMGRGQNGKKKVYEIVVDFNVVTFSWGMAEKTQRQTNRIVCRDSQQAMMVARDKKWAKLDRGYAVAYEV